MGPLAWGAVWVLAASGTAMLPPRRQMGPGTLLLTTAPLLLVWIGMAQGRVRVALAVAAFASLFRRPLAHLIRRARGLPSPSFADLVAREEARRP